MFGTGPTNLLEATVVTPDGKLVKANKCENTDLFWAIRGGGHGFGAIVDLTIKTHPMPETFGTFQASVKASSWEAFEDLLTSYVSFAREHLNGTHWGETINFESGDFTMTSGMLFVDLS